jgi:hypothetical protein
LSRAIIQIEGDGFICDVESLRKAALKSEALLALLIRHEQTV